MRFKVIVIDSHGELLGRSQKIEAAHISGAWEVKAAEIGYTQGEAYCIWKETVQLNDEQDVAVVNDEIEGSNIVIIQLDKETS